MKIIAMIPARLGSKRIPRKNIRLLQGKPLLLYAIETALESNQFDSVWVNSESEILGELATKSGAKFHRRPEHLATDQATNQDFVYEFLETHDCDYLVMVNTTSPLLRIETVKLFCKQLCDSNVDALMSTTKLYAETFYKNKPLNFDPSTKINSQDLPPVEFINWALTGWRRDFFLNQKRQQLCPVFGGKLGTFAVPKDEAIDLDTEEDWVIAEGMIKSRGLGVVADYYDEVQKL